MFETICRNCPFHRFSHTLEDAALKGKWHEDFHADHLTVMRKKDGIITMYTTVKGEEATLCQTSK